MASAESMKEKYVRRRDPNQLAIVVVPSSYIYLSDSDDDMLCLERISHPHGGNIHGPEIVSEAPSTHPYPPQINVVSRGDTSSTDSQCDCEVDKEPTPLARCSTSPVHGVPWDDRRPASLHDWVGWPKNLTDVHIPANVQVVTIEYQEDVSDSDSGVTDS